MKQYYFMFFICLPLVFFTSTSSWTTPRLDHLPSLVSTNIKEVQTFFYKQTLDHFNYRAESFSKFGQRYLINFGYWSGANSSATIFAYLGAEDVIDRSPDDIGFMTDNAASFKALLVYIEHRYYGKSVPFGSKEEAFKNASTLGYFDSAQALADYAEVLIHIKETLHAPNSPIVSLSKGLFTLSEKFNTCNPLNNSSELSSYLEDMYADAAQYYPVTKICNGIDEASFGKNILDKLFMRCRLS